MEENEQLIADDSINSNSSSDSTFEEDMNRYILSDEFGILPSTFLMKIKKEMSLFEIEGIRPTYLEKLFKSLQTIRPTSVESERAFSSMGLFATRLRTRLSDENLDALVFMRQHYTLSTNEH